MKQLLILFSILPFLFACCIDDDKIQEELKREREADAETHDCRSCSSIPISSVENCPSKGFECNEKWALTSNVLYPDECRCNEIKCADKMAKLAVDGNFVDKILCKDRHWTLRSDPNATVTSVVCAKGCDIGVCQSTLPNAPKEYTPIDVKAASAEEQCAFAVCPNGFVSLKKDGSVVRTFQSGSIKCGSDGYWRGDDGMPNEFVMCSKEKKCEPVKDGIEFCDKKGEGTVPPCLKVDQISQGELTCTTKNYQLFVGDTAINQGYGIQGLSCVNGEWIALTGGVKKPLKEIGDVVACWFIAPSP